MVFVLRSPAISSVSYSRTPVRSRLWFDIIFVGELSIYFFGDFITIYSLDALFSKLAPKVKFSSVAFGDRECIVSNEVLFPTCFGRSIETFTLFLKAFTVSEKGPCLKAIMCYWGYFLYPLSEASVSTTLVAPTVIWFEPAVSVKSAIFSTLYSVCCTNW